MSKSLSVILSFLFAFVFFGCVASSDFYTAKTLEPAKFAPGLGFDDIMIRSTDNSVKPSTTFAFVPSFLFACGLPLQFEADGRFVLPQLLEVSLRDQITPKSFKLFDFAPDVSFGDLFGEYTYLRYGGTLSKDLGFIEPYIHYHFYHFLHATSSDLSGPFFTVDDVSYTVDNDRGIGVGIGIPVGRIEFYPEFDYQYFRNDLRTGMYTFGIGIRGIPK